MASDQSQDDASQVVVLLDVNPFFWGARTHATAGSYASNGLNFSKFIQHILCLQGSPDAPQQYVAVMNAIFSAQRSMVPIDACVVGTEHSAFLQQAAHITGGIYMKPSQLEGLFQYLSVVFATDLHSRRFLQLPRPMGVDFRASCFCHKMTIDLGFVCSVCLSIFCKRHTSCSTCGAKFNQSRAATLGGQKRKKADD